MPRLRFVEINGNKKNAEILDNLPSQVVGHNGNIRPQLSNVFISRHHATVCYSPDEQCWLVIDGNVITGIPSKNGLKDKAGNPILGKTILRDVGDRVYLIYLYDVNAYLEVIESVDDIIRTTKDLAQCDINPEISKLSVNTNLLKGEVKTALNLAKTNKVTLQNVDKAQTELSGKVDTLMTLVDRGLDHVEEVGSKPKRFILGMLIFTLGAFSMLAVYGIYRNVDSIVKSIFDIPHQLEQKK